GFSMMSQDYAGIIFFSGPKQVLLVQRRYSPPLDEVGGVPVDDKADVSNYLEEGRDANFPDNSGNNLYSPVGATSNDIMFCIKPDMSVENC
ncbi:MAG: hypothetical protein ACC650_07595, partial [Gammaproteobacteria bacterium]